MDQSATGKPDGGHAAGEATSISKPAAASIDAYIHDGDTDPLTPDQVLPPPVTWRPNTATTAQASVAGPSRWLPLVFKVPVFGWALECILDERVKVRVAGLSVFVMSALLGLLLMGRPEWVIPLALVSGMLISAYRVFR